MHCGDRVLYEENRVGLEGPGYPLCRGAGPPEVHLDANLHIETDPVPDLSYRGKAFFDLPRRNVMAPGGLAEAVEGPDLHSVDAVGEKADREGPGLLVPGLVVREGRGPDAGVVGWNPVPALAPEKLIQRGSEAFTEKVPEGNLHRR